MGKAKDPEELECYRDVLLKFGHVTGYILWKQLPGDWLFENLPVLTSRLFNEAMVKHVADGGQIHQVEEKRPEYVSWRFHYDLRLPISGRRVYVETVLVRKEDIEDCAIWVVNIHDV